MLRTLNSVAISWPLDWDRRRYRCRQVAPEQSAALRLRPVEPPLAHEAVATPTIPALRTEPEICAMRSFSGHREKLMRSV
jgi:hypothetical protein